jgi:hypothetical protein
MTTIAVRRAEMTRSAVLIFHNGHRYSTPGETVEVDDDDLAAQWIAAGLAAPAPRRTNPPPPRSRKR